MRIAKAALRHWIPWTVALSLALVTALVVMKLTAEFPNGSIRAILAGKADFPFQYRVLSPALLVAFKFIFLRGADWRQAEFAFYAAAYLGFYVWCYSLYRRLIGREAAMLGVFVAFSALIVSAMQNIYLRPLELPFWYFGFRYPYDATQLVVVVGMIHALSFRKVRLWYVLLVIGTFNRETTLYFLPALYLMWQGECDPPRRLHLAISVAAWLAVKGLLLLWLGGTVPQWPEPFFNYDGALRVLNTLFAFGGLWIVACAGWSRVPADLRRLMVVVPTALVFIFLRANLFELRVYNELIPVVAPLIAVALLGRDRAQPEHGASEDPEPRTTAGT